MSTNYVTRERVIHGITSRRNMLGGNSDAHLCCFSSGDHVGYHEPTCFCAGILTMLGVQHYTIDDANSGTYSEDQRL